MGLFYFYYLYKNPQMNQAIKIPLRALNPALLKDLQEKYPNAEIQLERNTEPAVAPLSEERFWEIISLFNWEKKGNDDLVLEPAIAVLAQSSIRHICEFSDILSGKLYQLDQKKYAENIGEDAFDSDKYFSVDNFLYARACVVANGRILYENTLNNPLEMPKNLTFEALLYLPSEAYKRKTGKEFQYTPSFPIETYSNKEGWKK